MQSAAAHSLGISPATLARRLKENPQLAMSAKDVEAAQNARVKMALYKRAMAGSLPAIKRWLINEAGWIAPSERPPRTPQKMPLTPHLQFRLVTEEPARAPAATDEPGAAPLEKRRSRS